MSSSSSCFLACDENYFHYIYFFVFRLTDVLQKHKKDFVKTAITAVADFIGVFAEYNVEDSVKVTYLSYLYLVVLFGTGRFNFV